MHLKTVLAIFLVIFLAGINAQREDCRTLRTRCEQCSRRLNNREDLQLPELNRECRQRTARRWIWQDQNRCQITELSCRAAQRRLDCAVIAELAGMRRRI